MKARENMTVNVIRWSEDNFVVLCKNGNGYSACSDQMGFDDAKKMALNVWGRIDKVVV